MTRRRRGTRARHRPASPSAALPATLDRGRRIAAVGNGFRRLAASATPRQRSPAAGRARVHRCTRCHWSRRRRRGAARCACRSTARPDGRARSPSASAGCRRPGRPSGTVVAMEGGPGLSLDRHAPRTTSTCSARCTRTRNLLVVDARGTGRSALIDCRALQSLHRQHGHRALPRGWWPSCGDAAEPHLPPGRRQRSCTPRTCSARRPSRATWPTCSAGSQLDAASTCTATPTARSSPSPSCPTTRSCCARWCWTRRTRRATSTPGTSRR